MSNLTVHDLGELMTPASDDEILIWDVSAAQAMKIKRSTLVGATITGAGTIATGGYTLTVPATGTTALRGAANSFTAAQTFTDDIAVRSHVVNNARSLDVSGGSTLALAAGFVYQPSSDATFSGLMIVSDTTNGGVACFLMGGGVVVEMADTLGTFSVAVGTANSINVYWDGSTQYLIKNTFAVSHTLRIFSIRTRSAS